MLAVLTGSLALAVAVQVSSAAAATSSLVVRDPRVTAVYALHGTVLYDRALANGERGHWRRVVRGRISRARGIPKGASAGAIGLDALGNVVMTMRTPRAWWVYDVVRDKARRLGRLALRSCAIDAVALWRSRIAYAERCGLAGEDAVVFREAGVTRRVGRPFLGFESLTLRGRSIVMRGSFEEAEFIVPLLSQGRICRGVYEPNSIYIARNDDENPRSLGGPWIGSAGAEWVVGNQTDFFGVGYRAEYTDLVVGSVNLNGSCAALSTVRHLPVSPPDSAVHAAAIDGRWLYLATDTGIYRQRLAAHGSIAPQPPSCPNPICG